MHVYIKYIFLIYISICIILIMQPLRTSFTQATKKNQTKIVTIFFFLLPEQTRSSRPSWRRLMKYPRSERGSKSFAISWRHRNVTARETEKEKQRLYNRKRAKVRASDAPKDCARRTQRVAQQRANIFRFIKDMCVHIFIYIYIYTLYS